MPLSDIGAGAVARWAGMALRITDSQNSTPSDRHGLPAGADDTAAPSGAGPSWPVFWRVEGSLADLTAVRPVAYFTWNAHT